MAKMSRMQECFLKNNSHLSSKELAVETGLSVRSVNAFLKKLAESTSPPTEVPAQAPPKKNILIKKGVTSMTEAASIEGEDLVKYTPTGDVTTGRLKNCIHRYEVKD